MKKNTNFKFQVLFICAVLFFSMFSLIRESKGLTLNQCDDLASGCYRDYKGIGEERIAISTQYGPWYRGNTHAHSNKGKHGVSGCTTHGNRAYFQDTDTVATVYAKMGYDFLLLTDHRKRVIITRTTAPDDLDTIRLSGATGRRFYTPRGEEVGCDDHVTGLNTNSTIGGGYDVGDNADAVCNQTNQGYRSVPIINHPKATDSDLTASEVLSAWGTTSCPSRIHVETRRDDEIELWNRVLRDSSDYRVFPIASDDSHITTTNDNSNEYLPPPNQNILNPKPGDTGMRSIYVRIPDKAPENITQADLTEAIYEGNYYSARAGVVLMDFVPQPGDSDPIIEVSSHNPNADGNLSIKFYAMVHGSGSGDTGYAPPGIDLTPYASISWDSVLKILEGTLDLRNVPNLTSNYRVYVRVNDTFNGGWLITTPRRYDP